MEKKIEREGQLVRVAILHKYYRDTEKIVNFYLSEAPTRKKLDDLLDALCLCVVGMINLSTGGATIPEHPSTDNRNLNMQIVIPNLNL